LKEFEKLDEKHLVFLSIILQLLDHAGDIDQVNPNIQDYLLGLCEEFNNALPEEQGYYSSVYHYADTFFNNLYGGKETLH